VNTKVSDFRIAEAVLTKICNDCNAPFRDVSVSFSKTPEPNSLHIGPTKNVAHTIYKIISEYLKESEKIVGQQLVVDPKLHDELLFSIAANLRTFIYKDNRIYTPIKQPHLIRLYQKPLVWILMKDLVCPVFDKEIKNLRIVCGESDEIDIAKFYDLGEWEGASYPFIFINNIDNLPVQNAFLLLEAIKAHGLSPTEVMKKIYQTDLYDRYKNLLEVALDEEEATDFECTVAVSISEKLFDLRARKVAKSEKDFVKMAQNAVPGLPNQWWMLGVIEKMMEPTRGSDWSVYEGLQPYVEQFWNTVEEVKQKRAKSGKDPGVPFDLLLRLKSKQTVDYKADPTITYQGLLSSDRIW